jgi:hypothetical protein
MQPDVLCCFTIAPFQQTFIYSEHALPRTGRPQRDGGIGWRWPTRAVALHFSNPLQSHRAIDVGVTRCEQDACVTFKLVQATPRKACPQVSWHPHLRCCVEAISLGILRLGWECSRRSLCMAGTGQ